MFCPSFLRTEALQSTSRGGQKLLGQNDSTHAAQPSRDFTWRRSC